MTRSVKLTMPVKKVGSDEWADLSALFPGTHELCAENVKLADASFSFAGGHRVRLYKLKKSVHWKLPQGAELDISAVDPAGAPQRRNLRGR